jgi:Family of unknown function (DUF6776)
MVAVKGSKQYKMRVVPYRPLYPIAIALIIAVTFVVAVVGSYEFGDFKGRELQAEAIAERDALRIEVREKSDEAERMRQEVANLKLGSQVDRKASEDVRTEVIELKNQVAELQEVISFYRGLMSPTANKRGLTIGSLNVISSGAGRRYEYKLVVQQLATNHKMLSGFLNFKIVGRQGELPVTLSLKDVSDNVSFENIKLRFKYFQTLQGQLVLPEGFEPQRIELLAKSSGKDTVTVEKKFGWLVQES